MSEEFGAYGTAGEIDATTLTSYVRYLRGRVLIERDTRDVREHMVNGIIRPDRTGLDEHAERKVRSHRGRVMAYGPPALTKSGAEVPRGFELFDDVSYVYAQAMQKARTFRDGKREFVVVSQEEVIAVHEQQFALDAPDLEEIEEPAVP